MNSFDNLNKMLTMVQGCAVRQNFERRHPKTLLLAKFNKNWSSVFKGDVKSKDRYF